MKYLLAIVLASTLASGQTSQQFAASGHCREALPLLKADLAKATDPDVQKRLGVAGVRCGMTLDDLDATLAFISGLTKRFPDDPEVLYLTVHVFSDLSLHASQRLMRRAPASYQVHELNAEALETQGKWTEAEAEYREVLKRGPGVPGIHYRIGRLLLSGPHAGDNKAEARHEFEEELKVDPRNAGAEYVLGELARQDGQDAAAIEHFSRATRLDAGFVDAFIGLGRVLLSSNRAQDAIAPLETALKLDPASPVVHFELGTAYTRTGRKEDAARQFALQKQAIEKLQQTQQRVREGIAGAPPSQ